MRSIGKNLSPGTCTTRKQTRNKCSTRGEVDDCVLIDLDSDISDVIVIDDSESFQMKLRMPSPCTVINVDDDEVVGGVCSDNDDSAASSGCSSNTIKENNKSYPFDSKGNSPVNLSKCRRTYSGKAESINHYDLGSESKTGSTDDDCSDCECMDGPGEKLREQWELASKRRKTFNMTNDVLEDLGGKQSQNDILVDRQSIKETDEYKHAMEEEWASRQQQLQIQSEEAQRLCRRKRAESMRIMDVERRQKQCSEEVIETQRRDEANLNKKEQIRIEIRKELNLVERSCRNMTSLLQRLGLLVSSCSSPSQQEVQVAYKRGLLKFHPDWASRTDIHPLVEAEEKFKLISRLKEKF